MSATWRRRATQSAAKAKAAGINSTTLTTAPISKFDCPITCL
jgi:hypothetical protein